MKIALIIILVYLIQAYICAFINMVVPNRKPRNFKDLLKLTFLPWLLLHIKEAKESFDYTNKK